MRRAISMLLALLVTLRLAHGQATDVPPIPPAALRSGSSFLSEATRAQQADPIRNPGMLWVERGEALWNEPAGAAQRSCATCHGAPETMQGVAARLPAWDAKAGRLHTLETRIDACRTAHQAAPPLAPESEPLLALSALVAFQSRGATLKPDISPPARGMFEQGRALYTQRSGQLNLSCAQCHDESWGRRLRTETISQGHPNGYPAYRLEWQTLGSLHRRIRGCFTAVRAEAPAHGSDDHLALELYLSWRASGLEMETPSIRR